MNQDVAGSSSWDESLTNYHSPQPRGEESFDDNTTTSTTSLSYRTSITHSDDGLLTNDYDISSQHYDILPPPNHNISALYASPVRRKNGDNNDVDDSISLSTSVDGGAEHYDIPPKPWEIYDIPPSSTYDVPPSTTYDFVPKRPLTTNSTDYDVVPALPYDTVPPRISTPARLKQGGTKVASEIGYVKMDGKNDEYYDMEPLERKMEATSTSSTIDVKQFKPIAPLLQNRSTSEGGVEGGIIGGLCTDLPRNANLVDEPTNRRSKNSQDNTPINVTGMSLQLFRTSSSPYETSTVSLSVSQSVCRLSVRPSVLNPINHGLYENLLTIFSGNL